MAENFIDMYWQRYLDSNDKEIIIDNRVYYKYVYKEIVNFSSLGDLLSVFIPFEILDKAQGSIVCDERGNILDLKGPVHYRFTEGIPNWYTNVGNFMIKIIDNKLEYGDYFTLIPNNEIEKTLLNNNKKIDK